MAYRLRFFHAGPTIPEGGDPTRICLVCHGYIPEAAGVYHAGLRTLIHQGACDQTVRDLYRVYDRSPQGRFRPTSEVLRLVMGAGCGQCRSESA